MTSSHRAHRYVILTAHATQVSMATKHEKSLTVQIWSGAREPFFSGGGVKVKNQVLSCNMLRRFSPPPL